MRSKNTQPESLQIFCYTWKCITWNVNKSFWMKCYMGTAYPVISYILVYCCIFLLLYSFTKAKVKIWIEMLKTSLFSYSFLCDALKLLYALSSRSLRFSQARNCYTWNIKFRYSYIYWAFGFVLTVKENLNGISYRGESGGELTRKKL